MNIFVVDEDHSRRRATCAASTVPRGRKALMAAHKALAGRLKNGVYTYGFLRR